MPARRNRSGDRSENENDRHAFDRRAKALRQSSRTTAHPGPRARCERHSERSPARGGRAATSVGPRPQRERGAQLSALTLGLLPAYTFRSPGTAGEKLVSLAQAFTPGEVEAIRLISLLQEALDNCVSQPTFTHWRRPHKWGLRNYATSPTQA